MALTGRTLIFALAITSVVMTRAAAQPAQPLPLERIVRGGPVAIGPGIGTFGSLYSVLRSVGVPFGFEQAGGLSEHTIALNRLRVTEVKVSGLTLRAALDAVVAADPRYAWRYVDGVVVMRPIAVWNDPGHPLHRLVPPVHLDHVNGGQAVDALKEATGHPGPPVNAFPGTKPFSVSFGGGRLIDLLHAIVKAHGEMAWSLDGSPRASPDREHWTLRPSLGLHSPLGTGIAINGALLEPEAPIPPGIFIRGDSVPELDARDRLDILLPPSVTQLHAKGVTHLASSLGIPSGFEEAGAFAEFVSKPFRVPKEGVSTESREEFMVPVAGLTLRQALDAYVAADRRYEWREMDGVVVMRPVASWARADHPLAATAGAVSLSDARISEAFDGLRRAVESSRRPQALPFGDEQRISVDFPGGSVLHLANAIVRAYGRLSWSLVSNEGLFPLDEPGRAVWIVEPELTLQAPSGGMSIPLPGGR